MPFKILCISTHQVSDRNRSFVLRLIESVIENNTDNVDMKLALLVQNASESARHFSEYADRGCIDLHFCEGKLSLSKARNVLLEKYALQSFDFVIYPDDDCYFQAGFGEFLFGIAKSQRPDVLFIRNDEPPEPLPTQTPHYPNATFNDAMRGVNSNNIIVNGSIASKVGLFNELLGLGTKMGGGEDTDYAIRAFEISRNAVFVAAKHIGHRNLNLNMRVRIKEMSRYWPGVMYQTLVHSRLSKTHILLYRVAAGAYLTITRRITIRNFLSPFVLFLRK